MIFTSKNFYRGDCVDIIYSVLSASKKGETTTLAEFLVANKVIDDTIAAKYGLTPMPTLTPNPTVTPNINIRDLVDFLGYTSYTKEEYKAASDIVSKIITPSMSDYEKALTIHDYIINNTNYGYPEDDEFTAYKANGVFKYSKAVCGGYSNAFLAMADAAGLEATYVSSRDMNHAWNKVKIDGVWYHVDVTWDDPIGGSPRQDYFLLTDSEISKDHNMDYTETSGDLYIN